MPSVAVALLIEHLDEADRRHTAASARLLEEFTNPDSAFPTREHRRRLIADWEQLGGFGRLQAAGWQDKHSMVGLTEVRCRADQGDLIVEKRTVQIRAHRPLRDRTRLIAPVPASILADWFDCGLDDDALFAELGRSLPELPGARFVYLDKFGRVCAWVDGSDR